MIEAEFVEAVEVIGISEDLAECLNVDHQPSCAPRGLAS